MSIIVFNPQHILNTTHHCTNEHIKHPNAQIYILPRSNQAIPVGGYTPVHPATVSIPPYTPSETSPTPKRPGVTVTQRPVPCSERAFTLQGACGADMAGCRGRNDAGLAPIATLHEPPGRDTAGCRGRRRDRLSWDFTSHLAVTQPSVRVTQHLTLPGQPGFTPCLLVIRPGCRGTSLRDQSHDTGVLA